MGKTKKSKNRSNGSCANQTNAFTAFEKRMTVSLCKILGDDFPVHLLTQEERKKMHYLIQHVRAPRRYANSLVSKTELKKVNLMYQRLLREDNIPLNDKMVSLFDLNIFTTYMFTLEKVVDCQQRKKILYNFPGQKYDYDFEELLDIYNVSNRYAFRRVISGISDVSKKIFCISLKKEGYYSKELIPEVSAFFPIVKNISINDIKRPIYKLGLPASINVHEWATVNTSLLKDHYSGNKKKIDVYIQAHALKRMEQRLDAFGALSRNFMLAITFPNLKSLESYKGYLLIPIEPSDIRVGYLFCNVIDEMLVIRTFLFITYSATPEGDRLKEYTGLKRSDISYWKIDRMSTLLKINKEHWPESSNLFNAVGIKNMQELRFLCLTDVKTDEDTEMELFVGYLKDLKVEFPEKNNVKEEYTVEDLSKESVIEEQIEASVKNDITTSRIKIAKLFVSFIRKHYVQFFKERPFITILTFPVIFIYMIMALIWPSLLKMKLENQKSKLQKNTE